MKRNIKLMHYMLWMILCPLMKFQKEPVGLSLGMKPLGQSHFLSPPPPPYHSISSSVLNWNPTNIYMADFNNRLCSFNKWPKQIKQTPEMLALSGFYYHGVGDYLTVCTVDWGYMNGRIMIM